MISAEVIKGVQAFGCILPPTQDAKMEILAHILGEEK
jgi:hypothetical protein